MSIKSQAKTFLEDQLDRVFVFYEKFSIGTQAGILTQSAHNDRRQPLRPPYGLEYCVTDPHLSP